LKVLLTWVPKRRTRTTINLSSTLRFALQLTQVMVVAKNAPLRPQNIPNSEQPWYR